MQKIFAEAKKLLQTYDYELKEPRSNDLQVIAKTKVLEAYELVKNMHCTR